LAPLFAPILLGFAFHCWRIWVFDLHPMSRTAGANRAVTGSPACMTESEALAKFPKATHLYMRQHCWSDSMVAPVRSPRSALSAAPVPAPRPKIVISGAEQVRNVNIRHVSREND
jgi:hypothetical protein